MPRNRVVSQGQGSNLDQPVVAVPQNRVPKLNSLCSFGMTQLVMTGALRQVFCQHFADPDNLISESLRQRMRREGVWQEGPESGLYIESLGRWRPELTEARPGLVIKSGEWTWLRMGIGDQSGADVITGRRTFGGFWQGSHTIFVLGNEGAETQVLAAEVAKLLLWFGPVIADQLCLQRFLIVSIGELSALAESDENYVVPITVGYIAPEEWFLDSDAPRLKRIVFKASEILD